MSVKIRLQRFGVHKKPFYRIVAANSRNSRDGKFLEIIGNYEPISGIINIDNEKVQKWLSKGAHPTTTVKNLIHRSHKQNQK